MRNNEWEKLIIKNKIEGKRAMDDTNLMYSNVGPVSVWLKSVIRSTHGRHLAMFSYTTPTHDASCTTSPLRCCRKLHGTGQSGGVL